MNRLVKLGLEGLLAGALFFGGGCAGLESQRRIETVEQWKVELKRYEPQEEFGEGMEQVWQPPAVTIKKRTGDCEDFATLSAFYSGHRYGVDILFLIGYEKDDPKKELKGHAFHLLQEKQKYGTRGFNLRDNLEVKYDFKELVEKVMKIRDEREYVAAVVINLDALDKDWRTTNENLYGGYIKMLEQGGIIMNPGLPKEVGGK